ASKKTNPKPPSGRDGDGDGISVEDDEDVEDDDEPDPDSPDKSIVDAPDSANVSEDDEGPARPQLEPSRPPAGGKGPVPSEKKTKHNAPDLLCFDLQKHFGNVKQSTMPPSPKLNSTL